MLYLDVSKIPQGLQSFAPEGQVNFQALESKPNKFLKFYLYYLTVQSPSSPIAQQIFTATKQEMQRVLVAQYDAKNLSDYHFAKFLFHSPDLLKGREAEVQEIISKFADQLNPSNDAKTLRRASKILEWVRASPALREQSREILGRISQVGEYCVTSSDGEEFALDLSLWPAKVEAWRPWLIGGMPQVGPVSCSLKQLMEIDQFLKTSILPDLTLDGFMELYQKAEEILFPDLAKACVEKIKEKLSNETIGEILPQALYFKYELLILNCLDYIRQNKLISFYNSLNWSDQGGLYVEMNDISRKPSDLSTYLFSKAKSVHLKRNTQRKVSDRKVIFPEATCVKFCMLGSTFTQSLNNDGLIDIEKIFENFSICFPNAEEIKISFTIRGWKNDISDISLIKGVTQGIWVFKDQELFLRIKADEQEVQRQEVQQQAAWQQAAAQQTQMRQMQQLQATHQTQMRQMQQLQATHQTQMRQMQQLQATHQTQMQRAVGLGPRALGNLTRRRLAMEAVTAPLQQTASASADSISGAPQTTSDDASASGTKREAPETREEDTSDNEPSTKRARKDESD